MADTGNGPQHTPKAKWVNGKNTGSQYNPEPRWVKGKPSGSQYDQNTNTKATRKDAK